MPKRYLPGLCALAGLFPVSAHADPHEAWQAPTLSITRYDEDWSDLEDPEKRAHHWTGQFKYIPLSDDAWISTGIELRARNENYDNNLWGSGDAPDDSYLWLRAMPYVDLHISRFRAFVQPIAATSQGVSPAPGPIDGTGIDLLQGFVETDLGGTASTGGTAVTLRAGRQMLSLGTERLVGTRYGPNVPLAFDGLRAIVRHGSLSVSLLAFRPVMPGPHDFDDRTSHDKALWGIYTQMPGLDLYYLGYRNDRAHWGTRQGGETRHTLGARWYGSRDNWHWNMEGAMQFGQFDGGPILAWTLASEVGHAFPDQPLSPNFSIRFNVVSGDTNARDNTLGTFNALYPKGKYFGELSPVGPYNLINLHPTLGLQLAPKVSASLSAMAYWRAARSDGIYDIPGNLVRAAGTSRARFIGKEIEATLAWQATPELELSGSISAFAPGAFIRQTGTARTIRMIGLESNFRF